MQESAHTQARRPAPGALPWVLLAGLAAAWMLFAPCSAGAAHPDESTFEITGQITWVDPEARAFGVDVDGEELGFAVDEQTVILRARAPIGLEDLQPNDWVLSCLYRLEGGKRLCVRLEVETPPGEEGLE